MKVVRSGNIPETGGAGTLAAAGWAVGGDGMSSASREALRADPPRRCGPADRRGFRDARLAGFSHVFAARAGTGGGGAERPPGRPAPRRGRASPIGGQARPARRRGLSRAEGGPTHGGRCGSGRAGDPAPAARSAGGGGGSRPTLASALRRTGPRPGRDGARDGPGALLGRASPLARRGRRPRGLPGRAWPRCAAAVSRRGKPGSASRPFPRPWAERPVPPKGGATPPPAP